MTELKKKAIADKSNMTVKDLIWFSFDNSGDQHETFDHDRAEEEGDRGRERHDCQGLDLVALRHIFKKTMVINPKHSKQEMIKVSLGATEGR